MNYSFNLDWHELPESLQDEKISEYIRSNIEEYRRRYADEVLEDLEDEDMENKEEYAEEAANSMDEDEIVQNERFREEAEDGIRARFPMYF